MSVSGCWVVCVADVLVYESLWNHIEVLKNTDNIGEMFLNECEMWM